MAILPKLSKEERDGILADHGPGRVHMDFCILCGAFHWMTTWKGDPDDVVLSELSPNSCGRCVQAMQRGPEIVQWVVGVVGRLRREIKENYVPRPEDT